MKPVAVVISCEHAVNTVPERFLYLFEKEKQVLQTHRGIDFGAGEIATFIGNVLGCGYSSAQVTRLLIDCNRSLKNPACFSSFTESLTIFEKNELIDLYYRPYRLEVSEKIQTLIVNGYQVLHLSIHSFTPILDDEVRHADMGLLYDHERHGEKEVARIFRSILHQAQTSWRIRMNYPYDGKSDGFTSALRKQHHERDYLGVEIECNQALVETELESIKTTLASSLQELLAVI